MIEWWENKLTFLINSAIDILDQLFLLLVICLVLVIILSSLYDLYLKYAQQSNNEHYQKSVTDQGNFEFNIKLQ